MNINPYNYGHYRVTDYSRGIYQLYNRETGNVIDINERAFKEIQEQRSIEACKFVEDANGKIG